MDVHGLLLVGPAHMSSLRVRGAQLMASRSEGVTGRALAYGVGSIPGTEMTVAKCTEACKAGSFTLAGLEYGGECCKSSAHMGAREQLSLEGSGR